MSCDEERGLVAMPRSLCSCRMTAVDETYRPVLRAPPDDIRRRLRRIQMTSQRTVFLDRDGVINKVVFRDGRPTSPRNLAEFEIEDGVEESLNRLRDAGFKLFVVSNQPDIARGLMPQETLRVMTEKILSTLPVDEVKVCPHDDRECCRCRKPKP